MKKLKISLLGKTGRTKNPKTSPIDLGEFLEKIKSDTTKGYIMYYRDVCSSLMGGDSTFVHYDDIPSVCPACNYIINRKFELIMKDYNGLVTLEVGGLVNMVEIEAVKKQAALLPQTLAAFAGCDGHSVVIFAQATLPGGELPKKKEECRLFHAKAYQVAVKCYAPVLTHNIEIKQPRLDASFKMPLDPAPYVCEHATPFIIEQPKSERELERFVESDGPTVLGRLKPDGDNMVIMRKVFGVCNRKAIDEISTKDWTDEDKPMAEIVATAKLCAKAGMPEEEAVSQLLWHYYKEATVVVRDTVRLVYHKMKKKPDALNTNVLSKKQLVALQLPEFLGRRYDIRYNTVLEMTEYRMRQSLDFMYHELTKRDLNTILHEAALEGIEAFESEVKGLIESNYVKRYNPIDEYLWELGTWDGEHDYIADVANMVTCDNPDWPVLFRRWILSLVAQWMGCNKDHGNSTMPVLIGAQGYRKSTFCRILLPPELRGFYTDSIDFRTKVDAERMLGRFLLINVDEFDQLNDNQFAFVKHLTQKVETSVRRSYSQVIGQRRRYASFIGTSNHQDILRDPTATAVICVSMFWSLSVWTVR